MKCFTNQYINKFSINKMVSFKDKCNFFNRSQDLFKRCIDNVSFRAILGLGSQARFSLNSNVIFIWIMKGKQIVYHQNKMEKIRIQANCCNFFPLYNRMIEFSYFKNTMLLASLH